MFSILKTFSFVMIFLFLSTGAFPWAYKKFEHEPIFKPSFSPSGNYKIEFYAIPFLPFDVDSIIYYFHRRGMGCSDCPGYLRLVDNNRKEIIGEIYFGMMQNVQGPVWEKCEVTMEINRPEFKTWQLPKCE